MLRSCLTIGFIFFKCNCFGLPVSLHFLAKALTKVFVAAYS